ncbi:hypothetical protein RR48_13633 [Papilio machaon]|uniref:Uncharacterized protein n=1 Tax=Papilio machaon TaxID=76193 RepID=A0A194RAB9_PAPMA|nr:hypothetical protein RR48_13633 [Papilio machaon]
MWSRNFTPDYGIKLLSIGVLLSSLAAKIQGVEVLITKLRLHFNELLIWASEFRPHAGKTAELSSKTYSNDLLYFADSSESVNKGLSEKPVPHPWGPGLVFVLRRSCWTVFVRKHRLVDNAL